RVLRLHLDQLAVRLGGLTVIGHFELNMAHRPIDLGRSFVGRDGPLELLKGVLALARQVQGDRAREIIAVGALLLVAGVGARDGADCCRAHLRSFATDSSADPNETADTRHPFAALRNGKLISCASGHSKRRSKTAFGGEGTRISGGAVSTAAALADAPD